MVYMYTFSRNHNAKLGRGHRQTIHNYYKHFFIFINEHFVLDSYQSSIPKSPIFCINTFFITVGPTTSCRENKHQVFIKTHLFHKKLVNMHSWTACGVRSRNNVTCRGYCFLSCRNNLCTEVDPSISWKWKPSNEETY